MWINCENCDTEYKITSNNVIDDPIFCPYCANEVKIEVEFTEDDE